MIFLQFQITLDVPFEREVRPVQSRHWIQDLDTRDTLQRASEAASGHESRTVVQLGSGQQFVLVKQVPAKEKETLQVRETLGIKGTPTVQTAPRSKGLPEIAKRGESTEKRKRSTERKRFKYNPQSSPWHKVTDETRPYFEKAETITETPQRNAIRIRDRD